MAADDSNTKPQRTAADKEKSRQQSRAVSGKEAARNVGQSGKNRSSSTQAPAKKSGSGNGSGRPPAKSAQKSSGAQRPTGAKRPGGKPAPGPRGAKSAPRPPRRSPTALLTWGVVLLVLIIVIVLVVVKLTSSSTTANGPTTFTPAPTSVVSDVTSIPTSVYNEVGINSPTASVTPPTIVNGQTPLTFNNQPGVFYFGAEYCPYCAAERWAIVSSMSRFGKWSNLGEMESSATDVFPSTQTFTFAKATFTSPYLALKTVEYYSNQPAPGGGYDPLEPLDKTESNLVTKYDSTKYFPSTTGGSFPFINIGNKALVAGASYSPAILQGLSRNDIASGLSDPTNPVTQAIVSTSNYLSAATCHTNGMQPSSVCQSKGVTEAAKKLFG